jgi:hypothetical protein
MGNGWRGGEWGLGSQLHPRAGGIIKHPLAGGTMPFIDAIALSIGIIIQPPPMHNNM